MPNETQVAMADKRRKFLEEELIRIATELATHTQSPSFLVPYRAGNGRIQYVAVGPENAIHGLLQRARIAKMAHETKHPPKAIRT